MAGWPMIRNQNHEFETIRIGAFATCHKPKLK
jgi:hypothetical protein